MSDFVSLQVIGTLLGDTQPSTTARYAHLQYATLRSATGQLAMIIEVNEKHA